VHVDFTPAEVDAHYQPKVEVVAYVREALELLVPLVTSRPAPAALACAAADPRRLDDRFPLLPQRILGDLEAALQPDDLVISDVGAHKLWVAKRFRARVPNTVIISNGFAAMGIGLPGATSSAAKACASRRRETSGRPSPRRSARVSPC
jgi:acetolactate synthase-1/2/3 large subunit